MGFFIRVLGFFCCLLPLNAHAASIEVSTCHSDCGIYDGFILLDGVITSGDLEEIVKQYEAAPAGLYPVALKSTGGDVEEAMKIGRWVRKNKLIVFVPSGNVCASACVFILASGRAKFPNGTVAIHRPYLLELPEEGVAVAMQNLLSSVRAYLDEMNIPSSLAEDMFSTPPSETKILSASDLQRYRLNQRDIVLSEEEDIQAASQYGISRAEYMKRVEDMKNSGEMQVCEETVDRHDATLCIFLLKIKYGLIAHSKSEQ